MSPSSPNLSPNVCSLSSDGKMMCRPQRRQSGLRELIRPKLQPNASSRSIEKVTVIIRPGVLSGFKYYKGSSSDLKQERKVLKIPRQKLKASDDDSQTSANAEGKLEELPSRTDGDGGNPLSFCLYTLLDAQMLKFTRPETHWAPDIAELVALKAGDRVMICARQQRRPWSISRFWVRITDVFDTESLRAEVEACGLSTNMGISKGSDISFSARNIFNVHESCRDELFERYISIVSTKANTSGGSGETKARW